MRGGQISQFPVANLMIFSFSWRFKSFKIRSRANWLHEVLIARAMELQRWPFWGNAELKNYTSSFIFK